jgi:hypothetical protein
MSGGLAEIPKPSPRPRAGILEIVVASFGFGIMMMAWDCLLSLYKTGNEFRKSFMVVNAGGFLCLVLVALVARRLKPTRRLILASCLFLFLFAPLAVAELVGLRRAGHEVWEPIVFGVFLAIGIAFLRFLMR